MTNTARWKKRSALFGGFVLATTLGAGAINLPVAYAALGSNPSVIRPPATTPSAAAGAAARTGAATPIEAVRNFLDAEARRNLGASYSLLSTAEQTEHGSPASWTAAHAGMIPIAGVANLVADPSPAASPSRTVVRATVLLKPGIDEVRGLTPAQAEGRFVVVREGATWRIAWRQTELTPVYLDDASAAADVRSWVDARRRCQDAPNEYRAGLVGFPALAAKLCKTTKPASVGAPNSIVRLPEANMVISAFGPAAAQWARVLPVSTPIPMNVVVAPVGARWVVVGVTPL